ncbi:tetratricopeptide repeat protein [Nonomuraea phyllanthi]|uniref:Tetratricopeptide repeat protein n=1 Tax=Nonomuraea phyllanthi TaxID=2219224 RepID=A0A5C4WIF3_9ACTN|nr:BTAD domain-containing putative transcriptional regulator [Nonomuraea phyllanthi]KAB8194080.1 tetratricopeptide repeat protein [Nonomuraea phyllanthi]
MMIRLLGPVELERADQTRPVRPPQAALALAALAWEAGRVVPVETLLARIWGERIPSGARNTLYTLITHLRRDVLGDDGDVLHRTGGYLLDVDESAVDLARFRHLAERAAAAEDPGPPLSEALALWRGDPLTGLPGEWAERARRRLCDERKEIVLRWARTVTAGDPAAAVAALSPLAEDYPLDELVAAALIEALHAWGRTAEALACFAGVRRTLAEELGVEPGTALRRVHRMLLRDGETAEPERPVPAQLPGHLECFVGRKAELDRLAATAAVCVISGPPGVGKSSLALHWAHQHRDDFPGGQLHAHLGTLDPADGSAVLPRFLGALGVAETRIPSGVEAQVGLYRSLLAGRRVLVMLDDARGADQVAPLLATAPGCLTMITSRTELPSLSVTAGASLLHLDVLSGQDAHRLLAARVGETRLAADPEAAELIIDRCGRLPLALSIVAARMVRRADLPLAGIAADLERAETDLEPFADTDPAIDLRVVFGRSYRDLPDEAARLFRRLGRQAGPDLPLRAVASLAALPVERTRKLIDHLDRANLVELSSLSALSPHSRLGLHDLLRAYAAEQARATDSRTVRRAATRRLLDYYVHSACAASAACYPHRERVKPDRRARGVTVERFAGRAEALRWYAAESVALPAMVAEAAEAGLDRHAWHLAWGFAEFMQRTGPWEEILRVQAVALDAATRLGDRVAQACCHSGLARAGAKLGHDQEAVAHFDRAIELHRDLDEPVLEAHLHLGLTVPVSRVRPGEELGHALRALELFQQGGDAIGEARALNNAGWWRAQIGEYGQALADCTHAQRLLADLGYAQGEGHAWDSIAYVLDAMGDHARAVTCYERAAELFKECGDPYPAAETLVRLGRTHAAAGNTAAALDAWERAAQCYDALGDTKAQAVRARRAALSDPAQG